MFLFKSILNDKYKIMIINNILLFKFSRTKSPLQKMFYYALYEHSSR